MRLFKLFGLLMVLILSGCVTNKASLKFDTYFQTAKTIALLPPEIKIDQVTAGGVHQYRDDFSSLAEKNVLEKSLKILQDVENAQIKSVDVVVWTDDQRRLLSEQTAAFQTLADTIIKETYGQSGLKKKKSKNFDYTMGKEVQPLAQATGADALLFIFGSGVDFTKGRHAANFFKTLAVAVVTYGTVVMIDPEQKWIGAALVDGQTGDVIWFNNTVTGDIKNEKTSEITVKKLFKTFPKKIKMAKTDAK